MPDDDCYYFLQYTARGGFRYSATNDLISNLKKGVDRRGLAEYRYKEQAIEESARAFRAALQDPDIDALTFVPVPPSKAKSDPLYDNRISLILKKIREHPPVDIRELIIQTQSTVAAHLSPTRLRPSDLETIYSLDEALLTPHIPQIAIVDDVLTTGAHFKAVKAILSNRLPNTKIIGLFIARTARGTDVI
jgi:predicted amidophosphoribosyltransferase